MLFILFTKVGVAKRRLVIKKGYEMFPFGVPLSNEEALN